MKYIFKTTKGFRTYMCILFFLVISTTITGATFPYIMGEIVDQIFYIRKMESFLLWFLFYAVLYLLNQCLHGALNYIWAYLEIKYVVEIRKECFKHLLKLKADIWTKMRSGDVMSRIEEDTESFLEFIHRSLFYVFANTVNLCISIGYLFYANFMMGMVAIVMTPVLVWFIRYFTEKLKCKHQDVSEQRGMLESWVLEMMVGIKEWKILNADEKIKSDFYNKLDMLIKKEKMISYVEIEADSVNQILLLAGQLCIYFIAIQKISNETMTIGQFITCMTYFSSCAALFNSLGLKIKDISKNWIRIKRVEEMMLWPEENDEKVKNIKILTGEILFKDVSFGYGNRNVLSDINLKIKGGEKIAIIGKSGEGKSTLLQLLYRLYEPSSGAIYVDGKNLISYDRSNLRSQIAVVHQESALFEGSLRENITFSNDKSQDIRIKCILQGLQMQELIENLPEGLDTIIESNSQKLSGGQKQRIAIARCIYRKPTILILDEGTSALDSKTEKKVLSFIKEELPNTTILSVAHRFSAALVSDRIAVMEGGKISAIGTSEELMKRNELYRLFYNEYANAILEAEKKDEEKFLAVKI